MRVIRVYLVAVVSSCFNARTPLSLFSLNHDNSISGPQHMEGTFINFALEGSSAASIVKRKPRRENTRNPPAPWNQPPTRFSPIPHRKSAPNSQNSIRAYPTPETPSNIVEMEVENGMGRAEGWDTPYNMYAGQQIFSDVSVLKPARTLQPLLSPINMRSERPQDTSNFIQEALNPYTSNLGGPAPSSGLLLENESDRSNQPGNFRTSPYPFFKAEVNDTALSPLPLPVSFLDQVRYSPEITEREYISSHSSEQPGTIPRKRNEKMLKLNIALNVLESLSLHHITLTELLTSIVSGDSEFITYRYAFFSEKNRSSLQNLFSLILKDEKGSHIMQEWMKPHAVQQVCETIHKEMDAAKPHLQMSIKDITPDFISNWDVNKILEPIGRNITPTFCMILDAATETKASKMKQKSPKSRNRITGKQILCAQSHYLRSSASCMIQIGLGLAAWSNGASRQLMNILHQSCLSMSYSSIANILSNLADKSIEDARVVAAGPHGLGYDNINISSSIYVEQGPNTMSKVQSGTFAVIYELLGARPEDMKIRPMVENLNKAVPLKSTDLVPSVAAMHSYSLQTTINIVDILFKYVAGFDDIKEHPILQHQPRRTIPKGHKTKFYPLRASTIEEASIEGNLRVHHDVYLVQLKKEANSLSDNAVPCVNDQLTNARIRGGQILRKKDISPWERREIFQLAFGAFHLTMNLIWSLLHTHRGSVTQMGSLTHLFVILEKTRLGGEHPDYHTLLSALTQILEGLILNAWRNECGYATLEEFATTRPTPDQIIQCARQIAGKYPIPKATWAMAPVVKASTKKVADHTADEGDPDDVEYENNEETGLQVLFSETATQPVVKNLVDHVPNNTALLTRDLLYVVEIVNAVASGDFGRLEDILPDLACIFRGAGSNNYSTEILHLLFNFKQVWTPEFGNIMRDNILINPSGLSGHAMGMDLNIEHLIRYLKTLFAAKGIYANWDRLGNISAGVNHLQLIKKQVSKSMQAGYQGTTHKDVDTSMLVWRIANKARELKLQESVVNREGIAHLKATPDLRVVGYQKFSNCSLATFNKKLENMKQGKSTPLEDDDIPPLALTTDSNIIENEGDEINDISMLHDGDE